MTKTLAALLAAAFLPLAALAQTSPAQGVAAAPAAPKWQGYDEAADAKADIARALERARTEGKKVMVVFGANWCPDCRVLDQQIKEGRLKALVDRQLVTVKVDVGRFKKNLDLAEAYGVSLKKGIPTLAVLDANGRAVYATLEGEVGDARDMSEAGLYQFFDRKW
ncbi:MAG: thioredoxin family protein [Burkholderiaceae bacterium]